MNVKEKDLFAYVKPLLKAQGFRKNAKRWTKVTDHFTYIFFIQGSCFDKDDYYVRPGVIINDIQASPCSAYGHLFIEIPVTTKEEVLSHAEAFFSQWTSLGYLKRKVLELNAWEKRRKESADSEDDPPPDCALLSLSEEAKSQILQL